MKKIVLLFAVLTLLSGCALHRPRRFTDLYAGDASAITRIVLLNGINGEIHVIAAPEKIAVFFDLLNSLSFSLQPNQPPRGGYLYRVELYAGEQKTLEMTFDSQSVAIHQIYYDLDSDVRQRLDELYRDTPEWISYSRLRFELTTTARVTRVTTQETGYFLTARLVGVTGSPLKQGVSLQSVWVGQETGGNSVGVTADFAVTWRGRMVQPVPYVFEQGGDGASVLRVYNVTGEGTELLAEIHHPGGDAPYQFSLDLSPLEERPRQEGEIPLRPAKMLWAYYYPWYYANSWDTSILQDQPVLGYYGSDSRAVIKRQVEEAQSAGIDGFISSWWGPGSYTDENLRTLLDVAQARNFSVMINFELLDWDGQPRGEAEVLEWLRYAVSEYSAHPAYVRVDGRPVFVIWASASLPNAVWESILVQLRAEGLEPFLIGQFSGEWARLDDLGVFDGLYQYNILNVMSASNQTDALFHVYESTGRAVRYYPLLMDSPAPRLWAATVQPGYDDHLIPGRQTPILGRENGALYRATFDAALYSDPDWIFITTWNEWWEHTYIESSQDYGDLYLQITRKYAELWK
ncbi:MAG: glycoside hydrolase family 99-like domain-containing protein [Chloroflexi bacterium]|nr:glycoside hydrolase family 99-like domain-containing protein [Chloroflexota bacterium]